MATRKITIQELIDAAEKNGYDWGGAVYPRNESGDRYCVLEQAAMNLGLSSHYWGEIADELDTLPKFVDGFRRGGSIWVYNDDKATSYEDAVDHMKKVLAGFENNTIEINKSEE